MDSQKSTPAGPTLIPEIKPQDPQPGAPGGPAGFAGSIGTPAEPSAAPSGKQAPLPGFDSYFPPLELDISTKPLTETANNLFDKWDKENASNFGACINVFPSGEITGGFFKTGRKPPPARKGKTVSQEFTRKARKTIRRAVESGIAEFKVFVTLTFDPKIAQLDDSGRVDQAWAKKEFKRFLNTVKKFYDRRGGDNG